MKLGTFSVLDGVVSPAILSSQLSFIVLDSEHGLESYSDQRSRYDAAKYSAPSTEVFIRVPHLSRIEVQRALEIAPDGLMIPQIQSIEDAASAVDFCFYPPVGSRGISPYTRPFGYEATDLDEKKDRINRSLKVCLLVEGGPAIKDLEGILDKVSNRIHMIYFGLFDYSNSLGLPPELELREIRDGLTRIKSLCSAYGVRMGTIASSPQAIGQLEALGVDYCVYKNDSEILLDGLKFVNS